MKVVFILGSGHCGSTLLDILLDTHSSVVGVGEMHGAKANRPCTCGKRAADCEMWRDALGPEPWPRREIYKSKALYLFNKGQYLQVTSGEPIDNREFINSTVEAYRRLLERKGATILVDSSKEVERAELLSKSPDIDPIVIHMVRDGRGVTWSYVRKYHKLIPYFFTWFLSNLKIEVFRRRFRGKFIYLRYEDLVDDPQSILQKLCSEFGIEYEPGMLEYDTQEHHQIEGNRMRFVPGHTIYRDDKWRREMPTGLRAGFSICFGWLNAKYARKRSFR